MMTLKEIKRAFEKLNWVFDARTTNHAKELFDQCAQEERRHRGFGQEFGKYHPGAPSVADMARMFAVLRVAEYLIGGPSTYPKGGQYLHTQKSCFIAAGIADEFNREVRQAWADLDLVRLAALDYRDYVKVEDPKGEEVAS